MGYLAFGEKTKSVILFNLPNEDIPSICAKVFIIINLMGSFVVISQPVYHAIEKAGWYRSLAGLDDEPEEPKAPTEKASSKENESEAKPAAMNLAASENEGGDDDNQDKNPCSYEDDKPFTCCSGFVYFGFRTLIVVILSIFAFIIPNINILMVTGGSVLGTALNVVIPVLFYNRAYAYSPKNKMLEGATKKEDDSLDIDQKS